MVYVISNDEYPPTESTQWDPQEKALVLESAMVPKFLRHYVLL